MLDSARSRSLLCRPHEAEIAFGGPSIDMTVQTSAGQADGAGALIARLRAEHAAQHDKSNQALLLHECGVLEENGGEEPSAARDYLAAFNADPQFREPLESLVRILSRRKSVKNLGKLLDALTRAAATPEERSRAFWERASYLQTHEQNVPGAKELFEEAIGGSPEEPVLWLELELAAGKLGDAAARLRALEARAELATDPTWKALLFIDLAELSAASGETARAYELLGAAAALEGKARFRTQVVLEQVAAKEDNLEALSRALEGQADLIEEAIEDEKAGDATGVPRYMRKPAYAADAWLRAAVIHRRMGDGNGGAAMLERAGERLPSSSVIARARLVALESEGDVEGAAALAKNELGRGVIGPGAASLWLRVAEAAIRRKDREGALEALRNALQFDKDSIPARTLEIDQLAEGNDATGLAASIESLADAYAAAAPKGRAFLLAAWVWGAQAGEADAARAALAKARECGVPAAVTARVARTLASLRSDAAWYEDATRALLAAFSKRGEEGEAELTAAEAAEQPSLWFELGRSHLLRGDEVGAAEAFGQLAQIDGGSGAAAWLGRALGAYALGFNELEDDDGADEPAPRVKPPRSPAAIEELAKVETDPEMARALWVVTALRSARAGDAESARKGLRDLHQALPGDAVVAVFRAELERSAGDAIAAAETLAACAKESADAELGAALYVESALLLWSKGERARAVEQIEAARAVAPRAGATVLSWALRGADPDTIEGRRRAIDAAAEAGADATAVALERFGLESAAGDPAEALTALEALESSAEGDLACAAALARLLWPSALEQRDAVDRALDLLEDRGGEAMALARAERFRLARTVDQDRSLAASRAAAWSEADPELYSALEWIGAAIAAEDRDAEVAARRAAASHFSGSARAAIEASASMVALLDQPLAAQGFVQGAEAPAQLMNLELALPGSDPRRRSAALHGLGDALGDDAQIDAISLAGWSDLASGNLEEARSSFQTVVEHRPADVASWEGVRASSEALGDHVQAALAAAQLGSLCKDDARGAAFWEQAGLTLLEHTDAAEDAEIAFERSFYRDARRPVAFDKLFRAVRSRNEDDRLLGIIERRLEVSEDDQEIGKMYWERARVLRKKGDLDGALASLENVTMLEPDHVGALALLGEVCITKKMFAEAAPYLARLATIEEAPKQQRLMSGIAAVDLFENKLAQPDEALRVLTALHKAGLSTPQVRERLARVAARAGAWADATAILEQLMSERDKREGRMDAARLAMTIWRDKLNAPTRALAAVNKLLDESPDDGEAIDFVLATSFDAPVKAKLLGRAKQTLLTALVRTPTDAPKVELLAKIAAFQQDPGLRQATLGVVFALGRGTAQVTEELAKLDARVAARPQVVLDESALREIADPEDGGPIAELFVLMAETVTLALGPTLGSLGVTKKDRIEARGAPPLRVVIAEWLGAVGMSGDWDLYVGGSDPRGVHAIAGEQPAIVLGSGIALPFDAAARSAVAREIFALKRGITAVRLRDENTIASLVVAACIEAGFNVPQPPYAVFGEVNRAVKKEISRKVRKAIPDVCQRILSSGQDPRAWAAAAQRSTDRMAVIAAGDVSIVLSDTLKAPRAELGNLISDSDRARRLLAFVLSPSYLELRKKLGMGVR
jgi:predicted Zn-dependent protease